MDNRWPSRKPLTLILVKRSVILLLVLFLIALFYWTVGSFRSFLAETQLMLLSIVHWAALVLALVSGYGILASLGFALARRHGLKISGLLGYLFLMAVGIGGLVATDSLAVLFRGLG